MTEARSPKPEARSRAALRHSDTTFISITLIRALAIAGIIIENYHNTLRWHDEGALSDFFTSSASTVAGTFVHMFFVLSGYGLTLSCLRKGEPSWAAWASERFRKIVVPYWIAVIVVFAAANLSYLWAPAGWDASYSWVTLLAYLSFLRNIYEPAWTLNPAFWFMPALIGLYVLFPLLLQVLRRTGMTGLMLFSFLCRTSRSRCSCISATPSITRVRCPCTSWPSLPWAWCWPALHTISPRGSAGL